MVRSIAAIILVVVLALAIVAPPALAAKSVEPPYKTTPQDLPIVKLPAYLLHQDLASPMGKPATPPGQDKKPKPPSEPEANKWAVVIGIADYSGTEYDLWHPDEDAIEMQQALIEDYGFPEDNIKVLIDRRATARAILKAIDWLAKSEDADSTVAFVFCGHGFQVADSEGWDNDIELDAIDEGIVSYDMFGITDGQLREKFSAFETEKFALIFGQCFSGGMFDDDDDLQAAGRVLCSAAPADQPAWDYYYLDNTLFGYYFIDEGILQGLAETDEPADGVSMEEAQAYTQWGMAEGPETEQPYTSDPQIYDGFGGELIP